jgi:protein ImuA
MHGLQKQSVLGELRTRIAVIEKRPVLAEGAAMLREKAGAGFLVAPPGLMHEVHAGETRNAAMGLAFALGQARTLIKPERPAVFFMQLTHEAQQQGLPYGAGLASFGFDPHELVFVRVKTINELLWAQEEALGCKAVAAVIADIGGAPKVFDFTASRRLAMRAASGGASLFVLRYGAGREASAAQLRWRIEPAMSGEMRFDPRAPGTPRWQVTLERGRLGRQGQLYEKTWLVSWENGFEPAENGTVRTAKPAIATALSRPLPVALGDRLLQTA